MLPFRQTVFMSLLNAWRFTSDGDAVDRDLTVNCRAYFNVCSLKPIVSPRCIAKRTLLLLCLADLVVAVAGNASHASCAN